MLWSPVDHLVKLDIGPPRLCKARSGKRPAPITGDFAEALRSCFTLRTLTGLVAGIFDPLGLRGYAQFFFLAQKSNQNTWFSATLDFSLVFRWFSAFSPTQCTVVSKKTKLSCLGGFFSLVFKIQATAWFSWSCLHNETRTK